MRVNQKMSDGFLEMPGWEDDRMGEPENCPLFSFFAVSDLHITPNIRGKTAGKRYKAWKYLENAGCSFALIAGDVTNSGSRREFDIAQTELGPLIRRFPLLVGFGNHDYLSNDSRSQASPESRMWFSNWTEKENRGHGCRMEFLDGTRCFETHFCGVQILSLDCAVTYPAAAAGERQLVWLDEKLSESDGDRFRIVMSHFPLNSYVPGKTGTKQNCYLRDSLKQQKIFEKHRNILYFSGHTHYTLASDSPSMLFDPINRIAYFNTASVGNAQPDPRMVKSGQAENTSGSMGLYLTVFHHSILIQGIDFLTGTVIDSCCFDLDFS